MLLIKNAEKYKLISSMGTANKMDMTRFKITTIDKTSYDPLAKIIRKKIKEEKIRTKFKVVSSDEKVMKNGTKLGITTMSFGDGNGYVPEPSASYIKLVREVYRTQLNRLAPSPNNPNW